MMYLESVLKVKGKRTGLAFVREQGLELEVWNGGPRPCWSAGVLRAGNGARVPAEMVRVPQAPRWLMVLPTYVCTARHTWLPARDPQEIAAMLEFELPRLVPCRTQPWTWDYSIVGEREDGASQVLVFLCPLAVVEPAMEQVRALGIEPRLVTVSAALHAIRLAHVEGGEGLGSCGYVWWDYGAVDVLVMKGRRLTFLRGVHVRGNDSPALGDVELEVRRSLSMLRQQAGWPAVLPLQVGGTDPNVSHLAERLKQIAGVQVCEQTAGVPPSMGHAATDAVQSSYWRNGHPPVVGVNLLPAPLKERGRRARRRHRIVVHGLRIFLVVLLTFVCLRVSSGRTAQVLRMYERRLLTIAPSAQELQFLQNQLSMIQAQVQDSVSMLDIIGQLYQLLPRDVTIHYLSLDQNGQVVIRAQAKRLSQAFDCIDPLERSDYLANVRQNYAHLREMEGQVLIDFELRADLEKPRGKETGR